MDDRKRGLIFGMILALAGVVFLADLLYWQGFATWGLYLPLILASARLGGERHVALMAGVCSAFLVLDMFVWREKAPSDSFLACRLLGLLLIWLTSFQVLVVRRLSQVNRTLKHEVVVRQQAEQAVRDSDRFARATLDALTAHICVLDETGTILAVNRTWRESRGGHPLPFTRITEGANYLSMCEVPPNDPVATTFARGARDVVAGQQDQFSLEYVSRSEGEECWFVGRVTRFADQDSLRIVVAHQEITDRKLAEQARLQSEETARHRLMEIEATYRSAPIALCVFDRQLRWVRINERMAEINGLPVAAHIGQRLQELLPRLADDLEPLLRRVIETGESILNDEITSETPAQPGVRRVWIASYTPLKDDDGTVTGINVVAEEITNRKRAEEALRESEQRLSLAFRATNDGLWDCDLVRGEVWWNEAYDKLFGPRPTDTRTSWNWWIDRIHPADRERVVTSFQAAVDGPTCSWNGEYQFLRNDGTYAVVIDRAYIARDTTGRATRFLGAMQDITERRGAEEALHDRELRLRAILNTVADGIITIDSEGRMESVNPATERMFGYTAPEMVGQNISLLMLSPHREQFSAELSRYQRTGGERIIGIGREVQGRRKDETVFPLDLQVTKVQDGRRWFIGVLHDLSRRKELEKQVLDMASQEQLRLGQELHDGIGQELTGLGLMASALSRRLQTELPAEHLSATKITRGILRVHQQLRTLCQGLILVELDTEALRVALENLADRTTEQAGVQCTFDCSDAVRVSDPNVAKHLFRIAQEAVSNALRHGEAQHIQLALHAGEAGLCLSIRDDGKGFAEPHTDHKGIGIATMHYRAGMIDGVLHIGPAADHGTLVTCFVPQHSQDTPASHAP